MIYNHCVACGHTKNLNQHHLIPKSLGGGDIETNLITLCGSCHAVVHQAKGSWNHSELTKLALNKKKANGQKTGNVPYGFRCDDGLSVVQDEYEQRIMETIYSLFTEKISLRKIAERLVGFGYKPRGKQWHPNTIRRMYKAYCNNIAIK